MKKIEIYSTPTCHFCHMAKDYFNTHNVAYTDYDVASDKIRRTEAITKSGQMGVPVIVVDDTNVIIGFDQDRLAELLDIPT